MKKGLLFLGISLMIGFHHVEIFAQVTPKKDVQFESIDAGDPIICYSRDENMHTYVPFRNKLESLSAARQSSVQSAVFEVTYFGFSAEQQAAFQYAVDIWSSLITSDVPIRIRVTMSGSMPEGTLASTGWGGLFRNFKSAQKIDTWYVASLAEKIAGRDLNDPSEPDITMSYNRNRNFYTGTDGAPTAGTFDLVTISLHEIGHGLGFYTHTYVDENGLGQFGLGVNGFPTVYARAMENSDFENIFDTYASSFPSQPLGNQLTGGDLYFRSESFLTGNLPRLYAPAEFNGGSSIAHLNEATYPAGNSNSLMTPQVGFAEANHDPGISLTMLEDMGWINLSIDHDALLDTEDAVSDRAITAVIKGDTEVAQNGVQLTYTSINWDTGQTIEMLPTGNPDEYQAFIPGTNADAIISYYITANDVRGVSYTAPGEAPNYYEQYVVGADTVPPVLDHEPLNVAFIDDPVVDIVAEVGDNLGVNPLIMTYRINGVTDQIEIPAIEVSQDGYYAALHKLEWDLSPFNLVKGDIVEYKLRITDASSNANEAIHPSVDIGYNKIQIDQLNDPEPFYANDFNSATDDFVGSGFEIGSYAGFSSGIMHSDHPYRTEPGTSAVDTLILYQMLKTPIIVSPTAYTIRYDEVVLVEPGEPGTQFGDDQFWDYVVVEVSTDLGVSWQLVGDGYDCRDYPEWEAHYNSNLVNEEYQGSVFPNSKAVGTQSLMRPREISLFDGTNLKPGDEILVRFKLYADQLAAGWGWAIDNLKIQIDDIPPVISHIPTDYLEVGATEMQILAKVSDNSVLDSVTFEVNIDGNTELIGVDEETELYELNLSFNPATAATVIKYRMIAVDSAATPNITYLPESGFFEIPVAEMGEVRTVYSTDFNTASDDFYGASYQVAQVSGFNSPAIHSTHPYPNAPVDPDTLSYLLKYPIKTNTNHAWMAFDEVALVNQSGDGVTVEVSNDAGANWYPVVNRYGATAHSNWNTAFFPKDAKGNSTGVGSEGLYQRRTIDLLTPPEINGGDEILVRFSMIVDNIKYGWGWAIDNLEIQDVTTGIELTQAIDIDIYPNPAERGRFRIKGQLETSQATIAITDMTGKMVFTEMLNTIGGLDKEFNLTGVKPGLYLVSISTAEGLSSARLIIR